MVAYKAVSSRMIIGIVILVVIVASIFAVSQYVFKPKPVETTPTTTTTTVTSPTTTYTPTTITTTTTTITTTTPTEITTTTVTETTTATTPTKTTTPATTTVTTPTTVTTTTTTATTTTTTPTTTVTTTATTTTTSPTPTPTEEVVLRVITRHGYDILDRAKGAFLKSELAKKYRIVDIRWLPVDPSQWIDLIKLSAKKPGKEIDVAWGGGPTLFDMLNMEGLLAPLSSDEVMKVIKEIPDNIAGSSMKRLNKEGKIVWVAAAIASFGFTINKKYLEKMGLPMPDSWISLANETYAITLPAPSVGVADATRSTSNTRMYEIIVQAYGWNEGWKIITLMGANSRIYDQSGLVRDAVIRGDIGVGITIDFYGYTAQIQNPGICKYILPKDGTIVNGDPIALLTTSKHPEAAQAFIAWVLSVEGQKIWLDENINRMPVNAKVFETPEGKKRSDLYEAYKSTLKASTIEFSDELALSYEEALRWFFHAAITLPHDTLQKVWKELAIARLKGKINAKTFKELIDELGNPSKLKFIDPKTGKEATFTQEFAQKINPLIIKDAYYRMDLVKAWRKAAEERYLAVESKLKELLGS